MLQFDESKQRFENRLRDVQNYPFPEDDPHDVCFDIGGNIGYFAIRAAQSYARVYTVEPVLWNYERLVAHVSDYSNIKHIQRTAWSVSGDYPPLMRYDKLDGGYDPESGSCSAVPWNNGEYGWDPSAEIEEVRSADWAELLAWSGESSVDLLKVDIEGGEYPFLMAADLSMVRHITMELHYMMGQEKQDELKAHLEQWFEAPDWGPCVRGTHQIVNLARK